MLTPFRNPLSLRRGFFVPLAAAATMIAGAGVTVLAYNLAQQPPGGLAPAFDRLSWAAGGVLGFLGLDRLAICCNTPGKAPLNPALVRLTLSGAFLGVPLFHDVVGLQSVFEILCCAAGFALGLLAALDYGCRSLRPGGELPATAAKRAALGVAALALLLAGMLAHAKPPVLFTGFLAGGALLSFAGLMGLREYSRNPQARALRPCLVRLSCGAGLLAMFAAASA